MTLRFKRQFRLAWRGLVRGTVGRLLARRAAVARDRMQDRIAHIVPLELPEKPQVEVHMLCGQHSWDMGAVASWSLLRFLPTAGFVLHSDGTLRPDAVAHWSRLLKGMRVFSVDGVDPRLSSLLAGLPRVGAFRREHRYSPKIVDTHLFASTPGIVLLDSDVLCLRHPDLVVRRLCEGPQGLAWNQDYKDSYALPDDVIRRELRWSLPRRLNAGFMVTPRFDEDWWQELEAQLDLLCGRYHVSLQHPFLEQMLYARRAELTPGSSPLVPGYQIHAGGTRRSDVVRHYVGDPMIRPHFFLDAVRLLEKKG